MIPRAWPLKEARTAGGYQLRGCGSTAGLHCQCAPTPTNMRTPRRHRPHALGDARRQTDENAHFHFDAKERVGVVPGVIMNADARGQLQAEGIVFWSQTDTEVIAQLIGRELDADPSMELRDAVRGRNVRGRGAAVLSVKDPDSWWWLVMEAHEHRAGAGKNVHSIRNLSVQPTHEEFYCDARWGNRRRAGRRHVVRYS